MAKRIFGKIKDIFSSDDSGSAGFGSKSGSSNGPKGMSVHIGINSVDPNHYKKPDGTGWEGKLNACERDANDMSKIAEENGFQTKTILTKDATRKNVEKAIENAAKKLDAGDIFLISYSGHGGQVPDFSGDEEEVTKGDDMDETWCLYDGQLLDDEIYLLYGKFKPGVRILVFSDSCHSGTVTRVFGDDEIVDDSEGAVRAMPKDNADATFFENEKFYAKLGESMPKEIHVGAPILLISGCQDEQLSRDGMLNGRFTGFLKKVLADGDFTNYKELHQKIEARMPEDQKPNYLMLGEAPEFEGQRPFQI